MMNERVRRGAGLALIAGGIGVAIVNVPSRWYGAGGGDSYVFDPPTFSPLWIERTAVPVASVLVGALLLAGFIGLVYRDWDGAGLVRKGAGVVTLVGLALLEVAQTGLWDRGTAATDALLGLLAVLGALLGGLLLVVGLVVLGASYARADARRLGYALVGGPALAVVVVAVGIAGGISFASGYGVILPFVAVFVAAGYDLWSRRGPIERPTPEASDATESDGGR